MRRRKLIGRIAAIIILVAIIFAARYAWKAFPIISGYGAKNLCSAVYLQHRHPDSVIKQDLSAFPFSLATYKINEEDSSITATIWGLARKKAIYRKGLGATLVNDISEKEIRAQQFNLPSIPPGDADSVVWPAGNKLVDSFPAAIDKQELESILENSIHEEYKGKYSQTRALLVVYDGQLIAEKYAPGFDRHTLMLGWSVSKSLTAALIGVLVKQGKLDLDAPAPIPEWRNTEKQKITIKQLLQQTSGIDFKENYSSPSEVTRMLFQKGDMAAFTIKLPLKHEPGTVFNYSSGNSNILGRIIRQTIGEKDYAAFPYQHLFYKTGMYSMLLEPDASGTYVASSYCYATARDFARFGLLYYNNGVWNGEQLLTESWVKESIQPAAADKRKHYGYQFWLNGFAAKDSSRRWFPDVPADMYYADGYGGQDIYIIPSARLVVVRLGLNVIDDNKLLRQIIAAIN